MSQKIEFDYEDNHYVLEYNREAIKAMEANGFSASDYIKKPMTMIDLAFQGLFYKNHKMISTDKIEEIFSHIKDKQGLNRTMMSMIEEAYDVLFDEKQEDDGKNIDWKIV